MSVLFLNVCRLYVPNIVSLGICLKKLHIIKIGAFAWYRVKIHVIFGVELDTISFKVGAFFSETQCIVL